MGGCLPRCFTALGHLSHYTDMTIQMSQGQFDPSAQHDAALQRDELVRPFLDACKPREQWRIGIEAERFGVLVDAGTPMQYDGANGIVGLFKLLVAGHGWTPEAEVAGGPVVSLARGASAITLEPGGQLELSGAPHVTLHDLAAEVAAHAGELGEVSATLGIRWIGLGFHPLATQDQLGWVPKFRYGVMREYLASRGACAHDMMRRTATVQANFDFASEADAIRKLRVALRLSPVISTMFANSPFVEGKPFGGKSRRMQVWLDVDPDRQGLLPAMWREDATLQDYIEWALDVPMFLIKRRGHFVRNAGQTFRSFLTDGFQGHRATLADWVMHLNTLFPEVRLKRTLEVRGADSVPCASMAALPAIWTGLLYDDRSLDEAEALTASWRLEELQTLRERGAMFGLDAEFRGQPLVKTAERVVDIARAGLVRRARLDQQGCDESILIAPVERRVAAGRTPADDLLASVRPGEATHRQLIALAPA